MDRERFRRPGRGRPPKPADELRSKCVELTLTNPEAELLRRFAADQGLPLTSAIRTLAFEALQRRREGEPT